MQYGKERYSYECRAWVTIKIGSGRGAPLSFIEKGANATSPKGQLISKFLFDAFTFFQKTNENKSTSSKVDFFLFVFGRKVSLKKLFWICLTFMIVLNATHNLIDSTWLKKQQFSCQGVQNVSPLSFSNYSSGAHTAAGLLRWVNQLSLVADFWGPQ